MIHFALKSSHQHVHFHFTSTPQLVHASDQYLGQSVNERKKTEKEKVKGRLQLIHTHFFSICQKIYSHKQGCTKNYMLSQKQKRTKILIFGAK